MVEHLQASTAPMAVAQLRVLGGAMARVPADATAFAHRDRRFMQSVSAPSTSRPPTGPSTRPGRTASQPRCRDGRPGVYVNFLSDEGPDRVREAYPAPTWDRLVEVKGRYDPGNLFHRNQNIPRRPRPPDPRRACGMQTTAKT